MKWRVLVTPAALKMILGIADLRMRRQVSEAISGLAESPDLKGRPLMGELAGYRSLQAAGQRYRILYRIEKDQVVVVVVAVGRRKEGDRQDIYTLARRLFEQKLL